MSGISTEYSTACEAFEEPTEIPARCQSVRGSVNSKYLAATRMLKYCSGSTQVNRREGALSLGTFLLILLTTMIRLVNFPR